MMNWQPQIEQQQQYLAAAHYLLYVKITPEERQHLSQGRTAAYAASNMLHRVKPGDVLWFVNVHLGRLLLLGRLQVEVLLNDTALAQELVDAPGEWIEADWYALANPRQVEPMREMNITAFADQLTFHASVPALKIENGRIAEAQQLRGLRWLTGESAKLLELIWYDDEYTPQSVQDYLELSEDDKAYAEGQQIVRTVKQRKRSRQLVEAAKAKFKDQHGHLFCEACGFDFGAFYGIEYIEAHHKEHIASLEGERQSTADDLAMLCANCHRMIHAQTPPLTIEELKHLIQVNRG